MAAEMEVSLEGQSCKGNMSSVKRKLNQPKVNGRVTFSELGRWLVGVIHLLRRFGVVWGSIHVFALPEVIAVATSENAPDLVW